MAPLLSEISSGNPDTADVFFLVALVLFVIAAALALATHLNPPQPVGRWAHAVAYLGLASIALAWLVL